MNRFELFHLQANKLKLANLAGLSDETLLVVEPQASLLGDTGTKLVAKLRTDNTTMKTEMDKPRSSLLTGPIRQANDVCDATIDDIKRSIKAGSKSTVAGKASAGETLEHFMKPFWNLNKEPLLSQISMTVELLSRYMNDPALQQAGQTLAIDDLFNILEPQNHKLSSLYTQRLAEYAAETPSATSISDTVAEDYNAVCDVIVRAVNTEPVQEALVVLFNKTNDIRKKYSALSPAKIDIADAVTEPLPTYTYTGKAITPIPVMYYEGIELVFAVDFSVTYKNNVEVGEATVIMHGKGRFNGQHIRKFNIARTL
ncbi:MAG: DUF6261 family protein [Bacteroidales bacterium]|jgi:hypothetical protein|nr:DUF6261 family protein [Bacteroidales bacterium]